MDPKREGRLSDLDYKVIMYRLMIRALHISQCLFPLQCLAPLYSPHLYRAPSRLFYSVCASRPAGKAGYPAACS
jgi:hypothetical protein